MPGKPIKLSVFFCLWSVSLFGQLEFQSVKKLNADWEVNLNGKLTSLNEADVSNPEVVYFSIDKNQFPTSWLEIQSGHTISLFVNRQLLLSEQQGLTRLSLDSLADRYTSHLHFAVFQSGGLRDTETQISKRVIVTLKEEAQLRQKTFFRDFSILAILLLGFYFVALFRSNPRLTIDYLNIIRLLAIQDRDEGLLGSRITASVNLLFYGFVSFLLGLVSLVIISNTPSETWLFRTRTVENVMDCLLLWFVFSIIIFLLLFVKAMLIYVFSLLLRFKESVSIHFLNFVRLLFLVTILIGGLEAFFFVAGIENEHSYYSLLIGGCVILSAWLLLLYFKLLAQAPRPFFHLFSYLCPSELIPVVILLKVLFF